MVIAFPAIYLGLESQPAELLRVGPADVITRTTNLVFSMNHSHVGTAAIGCPAGRSPAVLGASTLPSHARPDSRWRLSLHYNPGFASKYSRALRAICFSPLYASNLGASSSGIHFARATSMRMSSVMSSIVPDAYRSR
jgi:hypothetical protein